ncbi:MAG: NADPH:quinone reductase, partial [Gammaproteobacteria bacterium]
CHGSGGSEAGLALIGEQGAVALDHRDPGHLQAFLERTGGRGADLILEMAAHLNLGDDLASLARGGRVVVIGCRGAAEIRPRELMRREADIRGMSLFNLAGESKKRIHEALAQWFEKGLLGPVIRERLPLEEAARAHELVRRPGALGKILLIP